MTTRRAAVGWRSTRASRRWIAVAWAAAIAVHATAALGAPDPTQLTAEVHPPRAFGHQVGDLLSGSVTVHVPDGLTFDATSLPQPGARGRALELRRVEHGSTREAGGTRLELTLDYQVFLSPREPGTIETPTLGLRFEGRPREQTLRIEGWPVTVAPLVPVDVSPRRGLGEMQPDDAPPSIDTGSTRLRLAIEVGVLLLLLGWLAQIYIGLPWWGRRRRPFAVAWRTLGTLPNSNPPEAQRRGMQVLHEALNATAGEVVFAAGIDRFLAAHPRFSHLKGELSEFFEMSSRAFFAADASLFAAPLRAGPAWLLAFGRRCRDAERGSA